MTSKKLFVCLVLSALIFTSVSADAKLKLSKKTRKKLGEAFSNFTTEENFGKLIDGTTNALTEHERKPPQATVIINQGGGSSEPQDSPLVKTSTTDYPAGELESSIKSLSKNIITHNKPAYEIQLTKKELPKKVKERYNRVCAKDKTIVAGDAGKSKKYKPFCFVTIDPAFAFTGGIRVGADIRTVENFFVSRISDLTDTPGHVHLNSNGNVHIDILYEGNKITQIGYYDTQSVSCQRIGSFVQKKMQEMGFRNMYSM